MGEQLAEWLLAAKSVVAFTGAGISTESGIPDFRSPGGIWSQAQPVYFEDFLASEESRYEYWRQKSVSHRDFSGAVPNKAHRALADWEKRGLLRGVITQNIDGLHQDAGSQSVLELHGTARDVACLGCEWREPAGKWVEHFERDDRVPDCPACGGVIKHATVSFGQSLPEDVLRTATNWSRESDMFLAMGSSLVVEPAASLPRIAREQGGRLVIINRDATPLDALAELVIHESLGDTLSAVSRHVCSEE